MDYLPAHSSSNALGFRSYGVAGYAAGGLWPNTDWQNENSRKT